MKTVLSSLTAVLLFACNSKNKSEQSVALKKDSIVIRHDSNKPVKANPHCTIENEVASLGIGLVIAPNSFALYDDSTLTDKPEFIDMHKQADSLSGICTMVFDPEYSLMHFACVGQTENAYQVLINHSQTKYLPRKKEYQFQTWEQYLLQSFGIRRRTDETGEIEKPLTALRKSPGDSANAIELPAGHEMFCAMEVQGDWLKVQYDCFYNDEDSKYEGQPCHNYIGKCTDGTTGWLRWRKDNKLLVDIFLMP
ncbi:MAG TPA: hypothetical protein VIM79_18300 [Niastella sp.]